MDENRNAAQVPQPVLAHEPPPRDDATMAAHLHTHLEGLRRERERLEELLMLDANWRELRVLDARIASGDADAATESVRGRQSELLRALAANRIFAARAKLLETIELLSPAAAIEGAQPQAASLSSRIVMLDPACGSFRTRLRVKTAPDASSKSPAIANWSARDVPSPAVVKAGCPDALELIDGLGRSAVERLQEGGVTRFSQIAAWTSFEVGGWRARLDGVAHGQPGWWIEQAALLATGQRTKYARRARAGEFAALVPQPDPEPPRPWMPASDPLPGAAMPDPGILDADAVAPQELRPEGASLTAETLVRAMRPPRAMPPPLPRAMQRDVVGSPPDPAVLSELSAPRRLGYTRPRPKAADMPAESEVQVVGREDRPAQLPNKLPASPTADVARPRTLLRRMKELRQPDRFEADAYAAYRGSVEEASVTILGGTSRPPAKLSTPPPRESAPVLPPASRFLRALTGKR